MRAAGIAIRTVVGSVAALAALLGAWPLAAPVWAGEARLVEGASADRVVVETRDAGVDEVLAVLAAHFRFVVAGAPTGQPVRFSGRLRGSLENVLGRVLRHQGHVIVRSAAAPAGVGRVVLIESKAAVARAPRLAKSIAAIKARMQEGEGKKGSKQAAKRGGAGVGDGRAPPSLPGKDARKGRATGDGVGGDGQPIR